MTTTMQKLGNSQEIRIPKMVLDSVNRFKNEQIIIIVDNGKLVIEKVKLSIVCLITNNHFPLHIPLDDRTKTTSVILCEHIKALDLNSRTYQVIENLPRDILENVIDVVYSEIEQIED